jgi:tight adherence protein B
MTPATFWLGRIAGLLAILALATGATLLFGDSHSRGQRLIRNYLEGLDRSLRFLRSPVRAAYILVAQGVCTAGVSICAFAHGDFLWLLPLPAVIFAPKVSLIKAEARRVSQVEAQVEPWINAVANALKASPSLGEAICSTTTLVSFPMNQELEVLVKQYELGTPLDQALENLSQRINSKVLAGTVTALKIARRSGGNLTGMLETAASSLREFARLQGVVRTKTAEGKAQTFVIAMIPALLIFLINSLDHHFFDPLFHSFKGQLIVAGATVLWVLAILLTRKILNVDI